MILQRVLRRNRFWKESKTPMANLEVVNRVNAELNEMLAEASRMRENPRIIRVMQLLAQLTHTGENAQHELGEVAHDAESVAAAAASAAAIEAKHTHSWNVFGRCACGVCQHLTVRDGVCVTCDEKVG
jgi:hypothetical protein